MSAQIFKAEDPRDELSKATRDELVAFAHANGQADISEFMPATTICDLLRARNLTNIKIPSRPLGTVGLSHAYGILDSGPQPRPVVPVAPVAPADIDAMPMGQLRAECKRRGIKMVRTDNLQTLRAKLRGQAIA